jgi:hypothetical protein
MGLGSNFEALWGTEVASTKNMPNGCKPVCALRTNAHEISCNDFNAEIRHREFCSMLV